MTRQWKSIIAGAVLVVAGCGGGEDASAPGTTDVAVSAEAQAGEKIYEDYCFSCHTPGLSGAPKLGDAEAWAPRIAKGRDLLLQTTIDGVAPAMPPRGICMSCSDEELAQAIEYMIVKSQ